MTARIVNLTSRLAGFACAPLLALLLFCPSPATGASAFPRKPITVVVYTGPGGLIDITARKFTDIASKYTDATFVVENKPGAGGIVAMQDVLERPADGYTLCACTKSNISKIIQANRGGYIDAFDWLAMLMADPECIITRRGAAVSSWEQVVADAKRLNGGQIWVGPAAGGLDHVMGLKAWQAFGLSAKWIPYKSGGKAIAALLGEQGVAYVGNPRDAVGKPDLQVAVVSSPDRLARFPDVPTFREFGVEGLDNEYMWRGFAVKKGVPAEILAWYSGLFRQVTDDAEWRVFWETGGIDVVYRGPREFAAIVEQDRADFARHLAGLGILKETQTGALAGLAHGGGLAGLLSGLIAVNVAAGVLLRRRGRSRRPGAVLIPLSVGCLSILFLLLTFAFPGADEGVGPSVVPRLWIGVLLPLCVWLLLRGARGDWDAPPGEASEGDRSGEGRTGTVPLFVALLALYLLAMQVVGYFPATLVFVIAGMRLLGYRRYPVMVAVSVGWIAFSYIVFYRLLYLPLPVGRLVEGLL